VKLGFCGWGGWTFEPLSLLPLLVVLLALLLSLLLVVLPLRMLLLMLSLLLLQVLLLLLLHSSCMCQELLPCPIEKCC
jgi:hypothetical protein